MSGSPVASTIALIVLMSVPMYAMPAGIATRRMHHAPLSSLAGSSSFLSLLDIVDERVKLVASSVVARNSTMTTRYMSMTTLDRGSVSMTAAAISSHFPSTIIPGISRTPSILSFCPMLMMVAAFGGYEFVMEAYKQAVAEKYRFLTFGDAMLII